MFLPQEHVIMQQILHVSKVRIRLDSITSAPVKTYLAPIDIKDSKINSSRFIIFAFETNNAQGFKAR